MSGETPSKTTLLLNALKVIALLVLVGGVLNYYVVRDDMAWRISSIPISTGSEDDYLLIPPSQDWVQKQVDKSLLSRGLEYGEDSEWNRCNLRSYYFHNIKTIFTGVPKTGCSNWIEALLRAEGDLDHSLDPTRVRWVHGKASGNHRMGANSSMINTYSKQDFNEAFSFTVVRNPWTRMVSAYRDKVSQEETQGGSMDGTRKSIVSLMRNITDKEELNDLYPTFTEFARWLALRQATQKKSLDGHFAPQWRTLCIPYVKYDFVVPLEFAKELSPEIWQRIGSSDISLLGSYDKSSDPRLQKSALMAQEWLSELDSETVEKLYSIYEADFIMMNYSNFTDPNFPLPLNEENKSTK